MPAVDTRNTTRDSLYLLAYLQLNGGKVEHPVRVRNLSATGLMVDGGIEVETGDHLAIKLRNIGWVEGRVAWVQDGRFGIALDEIIEPRRAREPVNDDGYSERWLAAQKAQLAALRKI